jgi:hypothetical protein
MKGLVTLAGVVSLLFLPAGLAQLVVTGPGSENKDISAMIFVIIGFVALLIRKRFSPGKASIQFMMVCYFIAFFFLAWGMYAIRH